LKMARFWCIWTGNHKINAKMQAKTNSAAIATARFRTKKAIKKRSMGSGNFAPPAAEYSGRTVRSTNKMARAKMTFNTTREKRKIPGRDFKISLSSAYTIQSDNTQEMIWNAIHRRR